MTTININGVKFEISEQVGRFGENQVTATLGNLTARGQINEYGKRIEFNFNRDQWLHQLADHGGWSLDDYETAEEAQSRPTDYCEFDLTAEHQAFIRVLRGK